MSRIKNKKGQMLIFFGLAFTFLFLLFAMVINISFIVTAKMNIQNAVDLAAYAGAAQQARYMTALGIWNYEMRRNYKAFAYDTDVVLSAEYLSYSRNYLTTNYASPSIACCSLQTEVSGNPIKVCNAPALNALEGAPGSVSNFALERESAAFAAIASMAGGSAFGPEAWAAAQRIASIGGKYEKYFDNYLLEAGGDYNNPSDKRSLLNYNRRLLAWNLQDYRNMQARIRGVHFGNIKLDPSMYKRTRPIDFTKNPDEITHFPDAPMRVAARIINGYTDLSSTTAPSSGLLYLSAEQENSALKNPVHNAAYYTFAKNLLSVYRQGTGVGAKYKLFHLVPKSKEVATSNRMAKGCNGSCPEFTGPYITIDSFDVLFNQIYVGVEKHPNNNLIVPNGKVLAGNFPVGIAKDDRVKTYYALVAFAELDNIPFNVYYGKDNSESRAVPLVAVAAARPFGSRIGPAINSNCTSPPSTFPVPSGCIDSGWDPLYPIADEPDKQMANPPSKAISFSILDQNDDLKTGGIKLAVSNSASEVAAPTATLDAHPLYTETTKAESRWRDFRYGTPIRDPLKYGAEPVIPTHDGMNVVGGNTMSPIPPPANPTDPLPSGLQFFENVSPMPIHPHGCRNSVMAWARDENINRILTVQQGSTDNYENYLSKIYGKAVTKILDSNRDYSIYVFKYPNLDNNRWDIEGKTKPWTSDADKGKQMEKSFARVMAASEFETKRYILPSVAQTDSPSAGQNALDWYAPYSQTSTSNATQGTIFGGLPGRGGKGDTMLFGGGSGSSDTIAADAEKPPLDDTTPKTESYAAWRTGLRGYKVKLINIKEVITGSNDFYNPIDSPNEITIPGFTGSDAKKHLDSVVIDLEKISY